MVICPLNGKLIITVIKGIRPCPYLIQSLSRTNLCNKVHALVHQCQHCKFQWTHPQCHNKLHHHHIQCNKLPAYSLQNEKFQTLQFSKEISTLTWVFSSQPCWSKVFPWWTHPIACRQTCSFWGWLGQVAETLLEETDHNWKKTSCEIYSALPYLSEDIIWNNNWLGIYGKDQITSLN